MSGLEMKYFVLKPQGDDEYAVASRKAMDAYADHILKTNPQLSRDLISWIAREWKRSDNKKSQIFNYRDGQS